MSMPPLSQQNENDRHYPQDQQLDSKQQQQSHLAQQQFNQSHQEEVPTTIPSYQPYLNPISESGSMSDQPNSGAYPYVDQQADSSSFTSFATPEAPFSNSTKSFNQRYQLFLDKITPHWKARWAFSLTALVIFMARIILSQGWYVVCYALAIYYLNLFIGFITPKIDPSTNYGEDEEGGPMLPTHASDEFKPFIRRLPEFKFWESATRATLLCLFLTLFEVFDIPVFWPILLLYFIILTACTMRQQIKHMIKWKYVPWDAGKKKYTSKDSSANSYPTTV